MNFVFESETEPWKSLQKKGWPAKKCALVEIDELPLGHSIPPSKKKDVDKLLTHLFGDDWKDDQTLDWYLRIVSNNAPETEEADHDEENCDCLEDDVGMHV